MKQKFLVLLSILILGIGGYSQIRLSGIVIDEESGKPVPDAFVIKENGAAVVSDSSGQFSIDLVKYPAKILVSHISYGQAEITIEEPPDGLLVIRIQKMISNLEEVQVSAERMRILTKKDDFSLQDFAGMKGLTVSNNAVYFLYPEKNYPFYTRLYRYQL